MRTERGQALLIVVLVMVVVLTVGLSVASRSIVNLRLSSEDQQSQRAFSAAEAGIDIALKTGVAPSPVQLGNNAEIKEVRVNPISGNSFLLNGGNPVIKDEGIDVWLVAHNEDNEKTINYLNPPDPDFFTLYWGNSSDGCSNAALEVIVVSGSSASSATAKRYAYDPCSQRQDSNKFSLANSGQKSIEGKTFFYNTNVTGNDRIPRITDGLVVRVIPLYSSTPMALFMCNPGQGQESQNCTPLPLQGKQIESTGVSGETTRKISLFQGYPSLSSEFFNHILFCAKGSGSNPNSCTMQ
ncbi:MAG: PilX N-terminal domain-containing pilus assembly protein [bacterium]|nr:PilX N-terminal domain-containing pilus assembly protein [bacterium]